MKMIVGLGNPGKQYNGTRHNIGFEILGCLAQRYDVGRPKGKFNAEVCESSIKNEKTILLSPLTFMNLSGQSVQAAVDFYKLPLTDLLVICDDINLDVGRLRFRPGGSAGGQNGLKDIINRLGSQEFHRMRVGVGRPPPQWDVANFVLGKFSDEDRSEMDKTVERAANAAETWLDQGIQTAMNQFNADPKKPKPKKNPKPDSDAKPATESQKSESNENKTQDNE